MADPIEKNWIPLGRRSEQSPSLVECYTEVFDSLTWANDQTPLPCVDTIIFSHTGLAYYTYDWSQRSVILLANLNTPATAIRAFMTMDESNAISAVWLSEVKDASGIVLTAEYLTLNALSTFFSAMEGVRRVGVLQRFVFPRPFRHIDEIAQEILVTYTSATDCCLVERRLGTIPMDRVDFPPTVRGNLFSPIPMTGKYHTATPPLTVADCGYGAKQLGERINNKPAFQELCRKFTMHLTRALVHGRRVRREMETNQRFSGPNAPAVRQVSHFVLQLRQNFHDGQLYFISVLAMRHPADRYHSDMQYELLKIPPQESVTYTTTPLSTGELDVPVLSTQQVDAYAIPSARRGASPTNNASSSPDKKKEDGSPAETTEVDEEVEEEEEDPRIVGGVHWRPAAPDTYMCPNCDKPFHRDAMVRLDYREILEAFAKQCLEEMNRQQQRPKSGRPVTASQRGGGGMKKSLVTDRLSPTRDRIFAATVGGGKQQRPQSAGWGASSVGGNGTAAPVVVHSAALDEALQRGALLHPVLDVPLVLSKLSVPLIQLPGHPVRLQRSTPLCAGCAACFGVVVANQPTSGTASLPVNRTTDTVENGAGEEAISPSRRINAHRRATQTAAAVEAALAAIPAPSCLQSDVLDCMVVSDLQQQHRIIREAERRRYQTQRDGARFVVENESHQALQHDDGMAQAELQSLLHALSVHETIAAVAAPLTATQPLTTDTSFTSASASAPPSSAATTQRIEVLGPGPDVPLSILLMNELYYRMEDVLRGGNGAIGGSDVHQLEHGLPRPPLISSSSAISRKQSALMAPLPRPSIVVPEEDLAPATSKHRSRVEKEVRRQGTQRGVATLKRGSRTMQELDREEQKLLLAVVGGDPQGFMDD